MSDNDNANLTALSLAGMAEARLGHGAVEPFPMTLGNPAAYEVAEAEIEEDGNDPTKTTGLLDRGSPRSRRRSEGDDVLLCGAGRDAEGMRDGFREQNAMPVLLSQPDDSPAKGDAAALMALGLRPGSKAAREAGCTCRNFVYSVAAPVEWAAECPVHGERRTT